MAESANSDIEDAALVREMVNGNQNALQTVFAKYGGRVKGYLRHRFGWRFGGLDGSGVLNAAACKLWETIRKYDPNESTLLAWFIRIAHNEALDELRKECRHAAQELKTEPEFRPVKVPERVEGAAETAAEQRLRLMLHVITMELKGQRQAVALADLVAGGTADRKELAARLGIPITQVDVTRTQTRQRIRQRVLQLEQEENSRTVKP